MSQIMTDGDNPVSTDRGENTNEKVDQFLRLNENYHALYRQFQQIEPTLSSPVSVIQTHCARLYLSSDFVIKIKRPVSYSYLDLAALSKRRDICERELAVNQPAVPDIYLCVAAIIESEEGVLSFSFDTATITDPDSVKEWCLIMRRFEEQCILDNIAQSGEFNAPLARKTGQSIASYHLSLPSVTCDDGDVRIDELIAELEFELKQLEQCFSHDAVDRLIEKMYERYRAVKGLLKLRSVNGFVRRCHGDLHLRNMLLRNDHPVPFDALEFDERLATTDVLYDLAFLVMDLCHRNLVPEANAVLNEYLVHSDERNISGVAMLDLFISIRAAIRAMTTAQGIPVKDKENQSPQMYNGRLEALSYLQLAEDALAPKRAMVVAVGGFSGSGKTTIARELPTLISQLPGAVLLNSDTERKDEFNVSSTHHLGLAHYNEKNADRVYDRLLRRTTRAIDANYPVIVDATFLTKARRDEIQQLAEKKQVDFYGVWLMAPVQIMRGRIEARREDASDADVSILDKQLKQNKGTIDWQHIDTSATVGAIVKKIRQSIKSVLTASIADTENA